jgi:poly(3-hydroxybutyrate) depolymerase
MLDALTAGTMPMTMSAAVAGVAPNALTVTDTSDTGAALAWATVDGATTYRVWRAGADGAFAPVGDIAGPSFGDSGLTPQSSYRWRVSVILNGVEGPTSAEAAASTRPTPQPCDSPGSCPITK